MRPPRATFTMYAVGFMSPSWSVLIMPVVSGVLGMWMVMKSAWASSSPRLRSVTPSCWARALVT